MNFKSIGIIYPHILSTSAKSEWASLKFVGRDTTGTRMEIAELPRSEHPYYVGCQYHPEFQSRPLKPSPPFHGLILAATGMLGGYLEEKKAAI